MKPTKRTRPEATRRTKRPELDKDEREERERERGREDDDEDEDERDTFRQRAEWWQKYHGDESGVVSGELRRQAIAHAERIDLNGLDNPDPGGARPAKGFEIVAPRTAPKARASRGNNPRPQSSTGFASDLIEVRGPADLSGIVLKIALDPKRLDAIDAATIRVFSFDDNSQAWQLVPRSGAQAEGGYAWAHLQRPGRYVAIGLQTGAAALATVLTLRALMPRLRAAQNSKSRKETLALIGQLLQTSDERPQSAAAARSIVARLDLSDRGLPEFDLLDELYRPPSPPPGRAEGAEIINRLRWDDIRVHLNGLFWFNDWMSIGPRNFTGRIKSLAIHPVEGNGLLAGAANGGVWQTYTGGQTWYPRMSQELSLAIGGVARSSADLSVLYAATGEDTPGWGASYPGIGVYKSVDGGATWTLLAPIESSLCTRVLLHPAHVNTLYVAGNSGLHKSIDGGASWTRIRSDHVSDAVMDPAAPDTIYAAVWNSGVYRTTDGGTTWSDFNEGLPTGSAANWIKLAASDPAQNGVVTLVAKMGLDSGQLFTRRVHVPPVLQSAKRRQQVAWPFPDPPWQPVAGAHEPAEYNEWTDLTAIDPKQPRVLFAGGIGLQRSADGGATFSQVTGTHSDHHALVFARSGSDLCYMASDGGIYRSVDNGKTWTLCSYGLVAAQLYSIGVSQSQTFLLGGGTQDQGVIRTNGSADWTDSGAGNEGGIFIVDPANGNNVYVTPWDGNLRRSTDGGSHWTTIIDGITQTGMPPKTQSVRHVAVCPTNSNVLLCCAGTEVFKSVDLGTHWSSVFTFATGVAIRVAWYGANTCYATSDAGDVVRSTQQGAANTWSTPYADANKPPSGAIVAIEARLVGLVIAQSALARSTKKLFGDPGSVGFPFNQDRVYIGYSYGGRVFRSNDGGAHWANASGSGAGALPNIPISALVIDKDFADTVYVATDIGVFRTRDAGANWEPFNSGLPRVVVSGLVLRRANNTLYVSTMGRGAYQRALS